MRGGHLFPGLDTSSVSDMDWSTVKVSELGTAIYQPAPVVPGLSHDVVVGQTEDVELRHGGQYVVDLLLLQLVVRKIQD